MKKLAKRIIVALKYIFTGTVKTKVGFNVNAWINPKKLVKGKWNFVSANVIIDEINQFKVTDVMVMCGGKASRELSIDSLELIKK